MRISHSTIFIIVTLLAIVFSSCKTSNDVANNNWLQKRKYRSGIHLNLGKNKSGSGPVVHQPKDSVIAELGNRDSIIPNKRPNRSKWINTLKSSKEESHVEAQWNDSAAVEDGYRLPNIQTKPLFNWRLKNKRVQPIEPSDDPHQDGLISIVLFVVSLVLFLVLPGLNALPAAIGLYYGIRARRGGEESLGTIGFIGNLVVLILASLFLLFILAYIVFFILLVVLTI